jgi:hypothetical protein
MNTKFFNLNLNEHTRNKSQLSGNTQIKNLDIKNTSRAQKALEKDGIHIIIG